MSYVEVNALDKEKTYFNLGCSYGLYKPQMSSKVMKILKDNFGIEKEYDKCCRIQPAVEENTTFINVCVGCGENFRDLYEGIDTITLWEVLDTIEDLPLPDHSGLTVSIHDPCSFRKTPHIYAVVRNLLKKMNIQVVEAEYNREKTICCGRSMMGKVSLEKIYEQQKMRGQQMPCQDVVTYCSFCTKSMAYAGKTPHHLLDLIFGEDTDAGELDLMKFGAALEQYKAEHQRCVSSK